MRNCLALLAITAFVFAAGAQTLSNSGGPRRLALVIGNREYKWLPPVPNAEREATLIDQALTKANFTVQRARNLATRQAFLDEITKFVKTVGPGDICFVYYTGYALQAPPDNSVQSDEENFLLPTEFDPQGTQKMADRAFYLSRMQDDIDDSQAGAKIFALEAARTITVAVRGIGQPGLNSPLNRPKESLLSFSAELGKTVKVDYEAPGLYTRILAENLQAPGLLINQIFDNTQSQVGQNSGNSQIPYYVSNITRRMMFLDPPPPAPVERIETTKVVVVSDQNRRQHKDDREYYVLIPKGTFQMGCVPSTAGECEPHENPRHKVEITQDFWLGENEVQVASYQRFAKMNGVKMHAAPAGFDWKRDSIPIAMVTWERAAQYCSWLGGRLPTEAEWEYALRGGLDGEAFPMKDFSQARDAANFRGMSGNDLYDFVAPVKKFDRNGFGLYDMSGNVWEWVADWYSATYYGESLDGVKDPQGPESGKERVIRGGSFDSDPKRHLRLSYRAKAARAENKIGFRCLLPVTAAVEGRLSK